MPTHRIHNFSAGPAVLPVSVLEELQANLNNLYDTGLGLMEISHRSDTFTEIVSSAMDRLRRVLDLPDSHTVLFLQGGASTQFLMVPQNLLHGGIADYLDTGAWSTKAIKEARRFGDVHVPFSGKSDNFRHLPDQWTSSPDAVYTHYTSNNTIFGTQYHHVPKAAGMLVCDMSSDIASRPINGAEFDVIYAGAQKNLGPSGVTVVTLSERALAASKGDIPSMLDYRVHAAKGSLFNTPNTLGIFVLERVLAWVEAQGINTVAATNTRKAKALYDVLESPFWELHADPHCRSQMNVTWRCTRPDLHDTVVDQALAAGFSGIKGHRSVGGLRASIYNACPEESVLALADFLREFEKKNG